jgi:hypothetical protein
VKKFRKLIHRWRMGRRMTKLKATIRGIDRSMKREGWPHWKRKQLWRDFIRSAEVRAAFVESISEILGEKP